MFQVGLSTPSNAPEIILIYLFAEISLELSDILESWLVSPSGAQLSSWGLSSPSSGDSICFYLVLGFCFLYVASSGSPLWAAVAESHWGTLGNCLERAPQSCPTQGVRERRYSFSPCHWLSFSCQSLVECSSGSSWLPSTAGSFYGGFPIVIAEWSCCDRAQTQIFTVWVFTEKVCQPSL